jgi:hypothetical protein
MPWLIEEPWFAVSLKVSGVPVWSKASAPRPTGPYYLKMYALCGGATLLKM